MYLIMSTTHYYDGCRIAVYELNRDGMQSYLFHEARINIFLLNLISQYRPGVVFFPQFIL